MSDSERLAKNGEALNGEDEAPASDEARPLTEKEALRAELADLNDKVLRLAAELENTRRRAEREKQDASRYAIAGFARDLLAVADTFERALGAAAKDNTPPTGETLSALLAGIRMTESTLLGVFERHGVRRIDPKGEKFDPNQHMAVAQAPGEAPAGHVLDVAQPGFIIGDRVLRAAMVVVSTGPASGPPPADQSTPPGGTIDTEA